MKLIAAALMTVWAVAASAFEAEWSDLQGRCAAAVLGGQRLDLAGLEDRLPQFEIEVIEDEILGQRLSIAPLGPGGRNLPVGVWGAEGGRFELWLLEYPTRAGFRAICEVRAGRAALPITEAEASALRDLFDEIPARWREIDVASPDLKAYRFSADNPRGCPVVTSFSAAPARGYLRSSVSEAAGAPDCGGPSLVTFLITPHGVVPSAAQPEGARQ